MNQLPSFSQTCVLFSMGGSDLALVKDHWEEDDQEPLAILRWLPLWSKQTWRCLHVLSPHLPWLKFLHMSHGLYRVGLFGLAVLTELLVGSPCCCGFSVTWVVLRHHLYLPVLRPLPNLAPQTPDWSSQFELSRMLKISSTNYPHIAHKALNQDAHKALNQDFNIQYHPSTAHTSSSLDFLTPALLPA